VGLRSQDRGANIQGTYFLAVPLGERPEGSRRSPLWLPLPSSPPIEIRPTGPPPSTATATGSGLTFMLTH